MSTGLIRRRKFSSPSSAENFRLNENSPQAKGLVGWWTLGGNIADKSLFSRHGTTTDTYGAPENRYGIYLDSGQDAEGPNIKLDADFTIMGWARISSATSGAILFEMPEASGDFSRLISLRRSSYTLVKMLLRCGGTNLDQYSYSDNYQNAWTHFAIRRQGNVGRFFCNGSLRNIFSGGSTITGSDGPIGDFRLLKTWDASPITSTGHVGDVRVYNRALTDAEIASIYNQTRDGSYGDLAWSRKFYPVSFPDAAPPPTEAITFSRLRKRDGTFPRVGDYQLNENSPQAEKLEFFVPLFSTNEGAVDRSKIQHDRLEKNALSLQATQNRVGVDFNGVNSYLLFDSSGILARTSQFWYTISFWFAPRDFTSYQFVLGNLDATGNFATISVVFGRVDFKVEVFPPFLQSASTITDSNWHHVVIERSGVPGSWNYDFYIDGQFDVRRSTSTNPSATQGNFALGRAGSFNGSYYEGGLHDVRIYDSRLKRPEIKNIYNQTLEGGYGDLVWSRKFYPVSVPTEVPSVPAINFDIKPRRKNKTYINSFVLDNKHPLYSGLKFAGLNQIIFSDNYIDSAEFGNNGKLTNSPEWKFSSELNRPYLTFDGVNQAVNLYDKDFWTNSMSGGFTICGWVRRSDISLTNSWLNKYQTGNEWTFGFFTGDCLGWIYDENVNKYIGRQVTGISSYVSNNVWSHFLLEWDGSTTSAGVQIWIDGVRRDDANFENPVGFTGIQNTDAPFWIAHSCSGLGEYFAGDSTDILIWDRLLNTKEKQIVANPKDASYDNLIVVPSRRWAVSIGEVIPPVVQPTPWHLFTSSM